MFAWLSGFTFLFFTGGKQWYFFTIAGKCVKVKSEHHYAINSSDSAPDTKLLRLIYEFVEWLFSFLSDGLWELLSFQFSSKL